jgi:hypothetical protein
MTMFCVGCGASLGGNSEFCGKCGLRAGQIAAFKSRRIGPGTPSSRQAGRRRLPENCPHCCRRVVCLRSDCSGGHVLHGAPICKGRREHYWYQCQRRGRYHTRRGETSSDKTSGDKRDGCALLSKEEASAILGLEVERIDGKPNDHESAEHCDYFVKPGSVEENAEKVKRAAAAIPNDPNSGPNQLPQESIDMLKALNRGVSEGARNGEAPYFAFTVERENGRIACTAFKVADRLGAGANDVRDHGLRNVVAILPAGVCAGPRAAAADVLADPDADAALLRNSYAGDESLAAAKEVDLNSNAWRRSRSPALRPPGLYRQQTAEWSCTALSKWD